MSLWRALKSWLLERRIQWAWERVQAAQKREAEEGARRAALWDELARLHGMRTKGARGR